MEGRVRILENPLLYKGDENNGKNGQNQLFFSEFFKLTSEKLAIIWKVSIQEKQLNLGKKSNFCDILTCLFQYPFTQARRSLENQQPWNHSNCEKIGFASPPKDPSPENCHYMTWQLPRKAPFTELVFVYVIWLSTNSPFPKGVRWKLEQQLFNTMAAWNRG